MRSVQKLHDSWENGATICRVLRLAPKCSIRIKFDSFRFVIMLTGVSHRIVRGVSNNGYNSALCTNTHPVLKTNVFDYLHKSHFAFPLSE